MNYLVKTHKPGTQYKGAHFFVLSRGRNTGKVLVNSCPNCWVILCEDERTADRIKGIVGAMHMNHLLRRMLIGSVIEYVRIRDFRKLLMSYTSIIQFDEKWDADIEAIQATIRLIEDHIKRKLLLDKLLQVRYYNLIKGL